MKSVNRTIVLTGTLGLTGTLSGVRLRLKLRLKTKTSVEIRMLIHHQITVVL